MSAAPIRFERPGRLVELQKAVIRTPREYQRPIHDDHVRDIAAHFDWFEFKVLIVAERADGYFVVDGQHRLRAVMLLPGIDLVPCIVYEFDGPEHEAIVYRLQDRVRALTARDKMRAEAAAGGKFGDAAARTLEFLGRLTSKGNKPEKELYTLWRSKPEAFDRIANLLIALSANSRLNRDMAEAFVYLEDRLGPDHSLAHHWDELLAIGYDAIDLELKQRVDRYRLRVMHARSVRTDPRPPSEVYADTLRTILGNILTGGRVEPIYEAENHIADLFTPVDRD